MASTIYRKLGLTGEPVMYNVVNSTLSYPDSDTFEVVGDLYASRIYGSNLSVFEVASSGRIAITTGDVYSFDMKRDNFQNVYFGTTQNDNMYIGSSNALYINCASNLAMNSVQTVAISAGSNLTLQSASNMITTCGGTQTITNVGGYTISGNSVSMITNGGGSYTGPNSGPFLKAVWDKNLNVNQITLNGDLIITGTLTTQNVLETQLEISDKTIELAVLANGGSNTDGTANTGSGFVISGVPSPAVINVKVPTAQVPTYYQKSVLWNYGVGGIDALMAGYPGGSTVDLAESYWEMRGGGLRITSSVLDSSNNISDLSYGFRVNDKQQLELYKRYTVVDPNNPTISTPVIKRLTRWGQAPIL